MKNYRTILALFCITCTTAFIFPVHSQTSLEVLKAHLQSTLDQKLLSYGIKGGALFVVMPNERIVSITSGVATGVGDPVDSVRQWHWASATKPLTGYIALKLIEDGLLHYDDSVGKFLNTDTLPNVDGSITIKQLLRHTSGFREVWSDSVTPTLWNAIWSNRPAVWQPWQVMSYMPTPSSPPPAAHSYANSNTYVLSFIIEKVTGKDLETVFQEWIFTPLGMKNSLFSAGKSFTMASLNGVWNGTENRSTLSHNSYMSSRSGNSGLVSTPRDVAQFYRTYYTGGLLSKTTMDSVMVPVENSRKSYGTFNGVKVSQLGYGYETEIFELVLANGDSVISYGHAGDGISNCIAVQWPKENILIVLVVNDMTTHTTGRFAKLMVDVFTTLNNDLPVTGVRQTGDVHPQHFALAQNYPNPFNPKTTIEYSIAERTNVKLTVYSAVGQLVSTVVDGLHDAGEYRADFDASGLPSGVYFYRLVTGKDQAAKKMLLTK